MQVRAIFEAACRCAKEGIDVHSEVMIPLTAHVNALEVQRRRVEGEARSVMVEPKIEIPRRFGTLIETPRAALAADRLARVAEFFCFGTNDRTQTVYGISRDDAEASFLMSYLKTGILPANPFVTIDAGGVGPRNELAVRRGRATRPDLHVGICGEHGGDPESIALCHRLGLDCLSGSPFRVPSARLAAAHAALTAD